MGIAISESDQRERLLAFRAAARTGSVASPLLLDFLYNYGIITRLIAVLRSP